MWQRSLRRVASLDDDAASAGGHAKPIIWRRSGARATAGRGATGTEKERGKEGRNDGERERETEADPADGRAGGRKRAYSVSAYVRVPVGRKKKPPRWSRRQHASALGLSLCCSPLRRGSTVGGRRQVHNCRTSREI